MVILALVAAIGIPVLARVAGGDPLADAVARLRVVDREARSAARRGQVELTCDAGSMTLADGDGNNGRRVVLEESITLERTAVDGQPLSRLTFDARGRSLDCVVRCTRADRVLVAHVSGLTGEWRLVETP
ncbi:MAG: hypothetical protein H0X45_05060 [Planctomycetes bacterium]|nr:hypothetical protein [Planctomycetota bacterium]